MGRCELMIKVLALAMLTASLALPVTASDGVETVGKLSDRDLFRLATCGATPGGTCQAPRVRWAKRKITVGVAPAERGYPKELAAKVSRALDAAISQINGAGANLRLVRNDDLEEPDIIVSLPTLSEGQRTRRIPRMPDGEKIGVGFMWLWWDDDHEITEATLLIAEDITDQDLPSVVLEELFQCLGFLFDIENPYYEGRSILSQNSNATTTIAGQDKKLLRLLYP